MSENIKIQQFNCPLLELQRILYPGKVINADKAIKTLGGELKISQVLCGDTKKLCLRFHPANPFNKAVVAEKSPKMGLLLKLTVLKSKKTSKTTVTRAEIVGYSKTAIEFDSLCDFQYLPISKNPTTGCCEFNPASIGPTNVTDTEYFSKTIDELFCIPQFFARADYVAGSVIYHHGMNDDGQNDVLGVLHKTTYDNRDMVAFNMIDPVPTRPDPQILKRMKVKYVSDEQFELIKKLFEDCPIWTRIALLYESGVSNDKLKCIIPSLAYYYSTGPWRTLFVRYGYDPRKDFKSRFYQTFDFRLRFRSGVSDLVEKRQEALKSKKIDKLEKSELVQDVDYPYFDENKLPRSRQCIVRYCDIRMPKVQAMIEKIPTPMAGATCNERTGWLPEEFDRQVRLILSNVIKDLMSKHCRKEKLVADVDEGSNSNAADTAADTD